MTRRLAMVAILCLGLAWLAGVADVLAKSGSGGFRSGGRASREDDRSYRSDSDGDSTYDAPTPETPRIQEAHITMIHVICDLVEEALSRDDAR